MASDLGISYVGDVLDLAASINVINKSGAWYAYEGSKIGQGRENAKQYLKDNPQVCEQVSAKVREHYGLGAGRREEDDAPKKEEAKKEEPKQEAAKTKASR